MKELKLDLKKPRFYLKKLRMAADLYLLGPVLRCPPMPWVLRLARSVAYLQTPFTLAWRRYRLPELLGDGAPSSLRFDYLHVVARNDLRIWRHRLEELDRVLHLVEVRGEDHFALARGCGRGLILATIHGWEFRILQYWVNHRDPAWRPYLVKGFPNETDWDRRNWIMHQEQDRLFAGRLLDSRFGIKRAIKILSNGGSILIAQDVINARAEPVRLFGREVRYALGAARLAGMTDSLILPVVVTTGLRPRWAIHFWPPIDPRAGDAKKALLGALEAILRTYPEAWSQWRDLH